MASAWSVVSLDDVRHACSAYDSGQARPTHPPLNTFLLLGGKRYPAKFIRKLAYRLATGKEPPACYGGAQTVDFFARLGLQTEYWGETQAARRTGSASSATAGGTTASLPSPSATTGHQQVGSHGLDAGASSAEFRDQLIHPPRTYGWSELRADRRIVPTKPGIYAWWFREIPPSVPADDALVLDGLRLLYVGISPSSVSSKNNLRKRIVRSHFGGNASGSTLRLSLGCLLAQRLNLRLRPTGSTGRPTFGDGETTLTDWMAENARVSWVECAQPWLVEPEVIRSLHLPLNLRGNQRCSFAPDLSALRSRHKAAGLGSGIP